MRPVKRRDPRKESGQGLVELALVLPIVLLLMVSVAELGVVYGNSQTLVYAAREGARVGSALATGEGDCDLFPSVDAALVGAVQRILKSPDSGIRMGHVEEIRIFEASSTGTELGPVNVWLHAPSGGVVIDPGEDLDGDPDTEVDGDEVTLDFVPDMTRQSWPACTARDNTGSSPDSLGVTVQYRYEFVMPVASVVNAVAGGRASVRLRETTVMALNPTVPN
jgi:hypothetical protein